MFGIEVRVGVRVGVGVGAFFSNVIYQNHWFLNPTFLCKMQLIMPFYKES